MKPLVSVVVPVYGVEKYLNRCVDSLLKQTLKEIEIILVDDGSKDRCPEMCDEYCRQDDRIRVIHKENGGLGYARNSGIDAAVGEYVSFVDSDDYVAEDFLEKLYADAHQHGAEVCFGGLTNRYPDSCIAIPSVFGGRVFKGSEIRDVLLKSMLGYDYDGSRYGGMAVWKGIYRLDFLNENGIRFVSEREYISEDVIFDLNLYTKTIIVSVTKDVGYFYCHNDTSLTTNYKPDRYEQYKKLHAYETALAVKYGLSEEHKDRITSMFFGNVRATIKQIVKYMKKNDAKREVKKIVHDKYLSDALKNYDYRRMPSKQKVFHIALKYKAVHCVVFMADLQNKNK